MTNGCETTEKKHYPQIDIVKCFAIVSVILVHSIPHTIQLLFLFRLYIDQQVSMFLILMSLTKVISFSHSYSGSVLKLNYGSVTYFAKTPIRRRYKGEDGSSLFGMGKSILLIVENGLFSLLRVLCKPI